MDSKTRLGFLLLLCLTQRVSHARERISVQVQKVEIETLSKYMNATANITRSDPTQNAIVHFQLEVLQQLTDVTANTAFCLPSLNGEYRNAPYNKTINYCAYLKKPAVDRILGYIDEDLKQHGTMPTQCPIDVGLYHFSTNFSNMRLPTFLPQTKFLTYMNFYTGPSRQPIMISRWYGILKKVKY